MATSLRGVVGIGLALAGGYFGARVMEARALGLPVDKKLFTEWQTPVAELARTGSPPQLTVTPAQTS